MNSKYSNAKIQYTLTESTKVKRTFYQKTQTGAVRVMEIELSGNEIITTHYHYGSDAKQTTRDIPGSKFMPGHASYKSPEQQAQIVFDRRCKKFLQDGNKESYEEALASCASMDFCFEPLSTSFRPPKPINEKPCLDKNCPEGMNKPNKKIQALIDEERLICQKKYNGLRHFMVKAAGDFKLYTMNIKPACANYPWLVDYFREYMMDYVPDDSVLDLELIANDGSSMLDFEIIKSMKPNTKPETAAAILDKFFSENFHNSVGAVFFDAIYWGGEKVIEAPYFDRLRLVNSMTAEATRRGHTRPLSHRVKIMHAEAFTDIDRAIRKAEAGKWEGLVVKDLEATSTYAMNARNPRPQGSWKWKTFETDDFIVTGVKDGSGRNMGKPSVITIAQYGADGQLVECGECGCGFTHEHIDSGFVGELYGKVVEVKFASRYNAKTSKSGKPTLQFPVFIQVRDDKAVSDCIYYEGDDGESI